MKRIASFFLILSAIFSLTALAPTEVSAKAITESADTSCNRSFLGFRPWYQGLAVKKNGVCEVGTPEDFPTFVWTAVLNIVMDLMTAVGYIATVMVAWGGISYIIATGDPGKITAAKRTIIGAVSGLIISILANVIINFIVMVLTSTS